MNNILLVFLGGGLGSLARYGISGLVKVMNFQFVFPLATVVSNILSCLILAVAVGLFPEKMGFNPSLRMFLLVGFCGGFSTFSTFSFETVELIRQGNVLYAGLNILLSTLTCIGIIYFFVKSTPA